MCYLKKITFVIVRDTSFDFFFEKFLQIAIGELYMYKY